MKKKKKTEEIVSLNEALFTFDSDDVSLEALERRLEMTFVCADFASHSFTSCGSFGCGTFNVG